MCLDTSEGVDGGRQGETRAELRNGERLANGIGGIGLGEGGSADGGEQADKREYPPPLNAELKNSRVREISELENSRVRERFFVGAQDSGRFRKSQS